MKLHIEHNGINIEVQYNNSGMFKGYFKQAINVGTGEPMIVQQSISGVGYEIKTSTFLMSMDVCDARYVRIVDADLFVPRILFIENKKS